MTELSRNEHIKDASDYLRGTLAEGLTDEITGAIVEDDQQLVKFHGMYLQDDRDLRGERARKKLEKAFAFMLRVRISGGVLTTKQWRALDWVARVYGNGTMRATTRQTIQLHGVIKSNLKATLKAIDEQLLNTIAACGDAKQMAKDVRATLVRAYADVKSLPPEAAEQAVAALERDKRYQQDVY